MYSPARNGKSVLRALRVPHELDEQIRRLCKQHSMSYSGYVIRLTRQGMGYSVNANAGRSQSLKKLMSDVLTGNGREG